MKNIKNILFVLVFGGLLCFTSCSDDSSMKVLPNDFVKPEKPIENVHEWVKLGAMPTAWFPVRFRTDNPKYDRYASQEDMVDYLKMFRDSVWNSPYESYELKAGFVCPGMDNTGCAAWGQQRFDYMSRENGDTYRAMWDVCLESKDSLEMVFIGSWSDYTEGHEIEPTVENGYRELKTTAEKAAELKGITANTEGLELPLELFKQRKECRFLAKSNISTNDEFTNLDQVAMLISNKDFGGASALLDQVKKSLEQKRATIKVEKVKLTEKELIGNPKGEYSIENQLSLKLNKKLSTKLNENNYIGYLEFEYLDNVDLVNDNKNKFTIHSQSKRESTKEKKNNFGLVAEIKHDNTGQWKKAKIQLIKENIFYSTNGVPSFVFDGKGKIKNIEINYEIF